MWRKVLTLGLGLALSIVIPTTCCWSACIQADVGGTWRMYAVAADGYSSYYIYGSVQVQYNGVVNPGTILKNSRGDSFTVQGGHVYVNPACFISGHIDLSGGLTVYVTNGSLERDKCSFGAVWKNSQNEAGMATGVKK